MTHFVLKRIIQAIIVLFIMSVLVFVMTRLSGDPTALYLPDYSTYEDVIAMRQRLGLDKPLPEQYRIFLFNLVRGDFGESISTRRPALEAFLERVPATAQLCGSALLLALVLGLLAGMVAAIKRRTSADSFVSILALLGQSAPPFVLALLLIYFLAFQWRLFPVAGYGGIEFLVLPTISLSLFFLAAITRLLRGSMIETLEKDYIRLARIKGLKERTVILKHALKNSIIPVITFVGPFSVQLVTAALAVEVVFGWPGIGQMAYLATIGHDFPLVQTIVLILTAALLFVNIIVDILYAWIDPRIRLW